MSIFFDSLVNITLTGPLVRLDFGVNAPVKDADGKEVVQITTTEQVVMPVEGFVRAFGLQEQAIQQLIKSGVLTPRDEAAVATAPKA